MDEGRRGFGSIFVCAIFGVVVVVLSMPHGGYEEHPLRRLTLLLAWGAMVGGAIGWLVRMLPPRARLPLGSGTVGGAFGFVGGLAFAVHILGQPLIDGNQTVQLASSLEGAGGGWVVGAAIGLTLASRVPRPTLAEAWRIRAVALVPIVLGAVFASGASPPAHAAARRISDAHAAQLAYIADAALVALTLLLAAGIRPRPLGERPEVGHLGSMSRWVATAGIVLGSIVLIALIASGPQTRTSSQTFAQERQNYRTLESIQGASSRYLEQMHAWPPDLDALRPYGARVRHGTTVAFFGPIGDGLCVVVGADHDGVAVDPIDSEVISRHSVTATRGDCRPLTSAT